MMRTCDLCGSSDVTVREAAEKFTYGDGDKKVILSVMVPVYDCADCGESYTDEVGEGRRHIAVCNHLRRLTPAEIKMLRDDRGMTQDEFAEVGGFGVASIKRWETGSQVQSASADRLLRLLRMPHNFRLAQQMSLDKRPDPQFKTTISDKVLEDAKGFHLRPSALKVG
ncbi:type II toxin-antitoxin system MqsA family antitoxin [Rhizobium leguminosarum]|uniref:type II TA system antitoxin MqsA family protein n=1 Tax=Rhizobium leguminosarum TaxID=384 RepID=UPI001C94ECE1|nr:type II TA system antitoxin MqsA family protein [Rhizobium leguminosarum]MBY5783874.1 type II toxin-antitoxin system MqsA family antitoxin [Rhizobium leguminosarum]